MSNMQNLNLIPAVTELTDEAAAKCAGGFTMTILKENGKRVKVKSQDGRISRSLARNAKGVLFSKPVDATLTFSNGDIGGAANTKRLMFRETPNRQATSIQALA